MKKIILFLVLFLFSQTAFAVKSYWVHYEVIRCYVPVAVTSWGGSDETELTNFVVMKDSKMFLTYCLDSCLLSPIEEVKDRYTHQFLGDSLLEFCQKDKEGNVRKVVYYRKMGDKLDLSFKNNPQVFRNGDNLLFESIDLTGYYTHVDFDYFYKLEWCKGNLYRFFQGGIRTPIEYHDRQAANKILFYSVGGKLYYETFYGISDVSLFAQPNFEACTLEEARAELQKIIKKRRRLIEN